MCSHYNGMTLFEIYELNAVPPESAENLDIGVWCACPKQEKILQTFGRVLRTGFNSVQEQNLQKTCANRGKVRGN